MQKSLLLFLLVGILVICFSQDKQHGLNKEQLKAYQEAIAIYKNAALQLAASGNKEALLTKVDEMYQRALSKFMRLLPVIENAESDSLLCLVKIKTGFINYYFGNLTESKSDYLHAMKIREKLPTLPDSLFFIPSLYTGGIYYEQGQFDSAGYYYARAEQINDAGSKPLEEAERLYNRMGAMYYDVGNYHQAKNYFEKAIAITDHSRTGLLTNYRINMATLLIKLEEYEKAKEIFEQLPGSSSFSNEINHNLGIISLQQVDPQKAIAYFRKVRYLNNKKQVDLLYNFALSFAALGRQDSVAAYIKMGLEESTKWYGERKCIPRGLILKFEGDQLLEKKQFREAVDKYQLAIMQFHNLFTDRNATINPGQFRGVYAFMQLFNTLVAKADAFEQWYKVEKRTDLLKFALQTYQAAFNLAGYVERTYNSDEARLFLGKIKYAVHNKPIDIGIRLYELTRQEQWLESAYTFDQQNKASLLTIARQENEFRFDNERTNDHLRKEAELRTGITRLLLKMENLSGAHEMDLLQALIIEKEIELNKLQEKINKEPGWVERKSVDAIPPVNELQQQMDRQTVIVSYHLSGAQLVMFFISADRFACHATAIGPAFFDSIMSFKRSLYSNTDEQRYNGYASASSLYEKLVTPFNKELKGKKRMIIIPDDELSYLPFEALQDGQRKYLVEHFSVQYLFSTALFGKGKISKHKKDESLSFAPFVPGDAGTLKDSFGILPASGEEIIDLRGRKFTGKDATKENFLRLANQFNTIHLATHASVNNDLPYRSYVVFYPGVADHKLYAQEIAGLRLDSTELVILSACETGAGQLVRGEGLMSLSRAFAYAGCHNVITSLWKAEDKTTAFLTRRLHHYLDKSYSKDMALQQAKIDWLNNKEIDARFKSPNYWAHLIFIGDTAPVSSQHRGKWIWMMIGILVPACSILIIKSLFAKNKQARLS